MAQYCHDSFLPVHGIHSENKKIDLKISLVDKAWVSDTCPLVLWSPISLSTFKTPTGLIK